MLSHHIFVPCFILPYVCHNNLAAYWSADSQDLIGDNGQMKVSLWKAVRSWWKQEKKVAESYQNIGNIPDRKMINV